MKIEFNRILQLSVMALIITILSLSGAHQSQASGDTLEGVALKDRTHVYESTNRNSDVLRSYSEGSILLYKSYSENWYEAVVFVDGERKIGYINASDVETSTSNPSSLQGIALKDRTPVYSKASTDSSSPRSYAEGRLLYYQTYTSEWYKAIIIRNGERETVYINASDVESKVDSQESLQGVALADRTHVYSRASRDASTLRSYAQGRVLYYKTFSSEWYEAIVIINGERQTGYIHRDDVDNLVDNQTTLEGIAKDTTNVYSRASRNSSTFRSYSTGTSLIYKTYSSEWYEAIVFINGERQTGYIHRDDVDSKLDSQVSLRGIATESNTNVYSYLSRNADVLRSYNEGSVLMYRSLSDNWHEAVVFVDGQKQIGYINVDDVENAYNTQESLQGAAVKDPTNVYSGASRDSSVLRSYDENRTLLFRTFSDSWYEATVIIDGEPQTGYIHRDDVNTDARVEDTTQYDRDFNDAVDKWMARSPQIWDNGGFKDATREDVIYYANPDNFSDNNANSFFQYLVLSQPAGLDANELDQNLLHDKGTLRGTGSDFVRAGRDYDVNEVYLIAHALHETGNGTSELAQGVEYNGTTVYNMYGIAAYDRCPVECGAEHAYEQGWDTPGKAVIGGAEFIRQRYLDSGQDTLYKMRWNPESPGDDQYATDVNWAIGQTHRIANLYSSIDNYTLFFDIPEYSGETDQPSEVASYPSETTGTTTASSLDFRSGPSTSDSVLGSISNGTEIDVLGYAVGQEVSGNDIWYQVKHNNQTGWVHSNHVDLDNLLQVNTSSTSLNVRSEPEVADGNIIGSLAKSSYANAVMESGSMVKEDGWYKVHLTDSSETGWVSGDYIREIR
ncbi:beta-N-acetylglucosaminidase/uncharacterized protein YraI/RNA polymerase subunit RPABC4/transcription elongation factor Spt4 [Alkalibacillus filiformis]|uniref:Beta-N-acetylglucosaminidase/uncharacterized protein YraI/RNA polymerase subunit RPABC4/transcription elongation factor Spt4 n=1 Tax=Alkalibacillus filiformis TaxID=200990 RepID=A0ABU0DWV3_9BACI|nr:SH3 domain-containing protein [Alkalibacillus filiformis]MDQ0352783.1 beta-N-acetylglucosaminidase/uncharacterized protein YraI/RNA polymerase subunit RPABC4/transcription elongation factor Spt4 [Alkalibacillus filiformis]